MIGYADIVQNGGGHSDFKIGFNQVTRDRLGVTKQCVCHVSRALRLVGCGHESELGKAEHYRDWKVLRIDRLRCVEEPEGDEMLPKSFVRLVVNGID